MPRLTAAAVGASLRLSEEANMAVQAGIEQSLIDEIVRRVLSVAKPDKIILFGSAAAGDMTRDSDIDLLIVERDPGNWRKESVRIRRAIGSLGYPFDVIVIAAERFERFKNVIGGIEHPADKYGKVVYDGD